MEKHYNTNHGWTLFVWNRNNEWNLIWEINYFQMIYLPNIWLLRIIIIDQIIIHNKITNLFEDEVTFKSITISFEK